MELLCSMDFAEQYGHPQPEVRNADPNAQVPWRSRRDAVGQACDAQTPDLPLSRAAPQHGLHPPCREWMQNKLSLLHSF